MGRDLAESLHDVVDGPTKARVNASAQPIVATVSSGTGARPATIVLGALLFTAAVALPLFRQTGARSWQTIWAEDGTIYFQQARVHGVGVLLRGYAGYEQLPPRLLALLSPLVPIQQLSVYLAISSALVAALLAWFVYHYSEGWITSRSVRLALASLLVLMPILGGENTANITNTIWVFGAVAPWALISLQDRRRDIVVRSVIAFLAAMATSLCLLFIPLALGYALFRKVRATRLVATAFFGGLVVQIVVMLHSKGQEPSVGHPSDSLLAQAAATRVFAVFLIGNTRGEFSAKVPWPLMLASLLCIVLLAALFLGAGRTSQVLALVLIAYAVVIFAAPVWYRNAAYWGQLIIPDRYSVIPIMLLGSAVAVLVAPPDRSRDRMIARIGRPVFAVYVLVLIVTGFSVVNIRSSGPTWSASLTHTYQTECRVGAGSNKLVLVRTERPKYLASDAFAVAVPCRELEP